MSSKGQHSCKNLITTDKLHRADSISPTAFNTPFVAKNGPYCYRRVDAFRRLYCIIIMNILHHPVSITWEFVGTCVPQHKIVKHP